jgi:hypothetical protein
LLRAGRSPRRIICACNWFVALSRSRKAHAVYKGGFSAQDDTIKWFWAFVETITPQQR